MEVIQLKIVSEIARQQHMTKAAKALFLTQPALSSQLAKLEDELGQQLFDRSKKGMTLTAAGEVFLSYAESVLGELDDAKLAMDELIGLERGSLSVGGGATATTYLLPSLIARFHEAHPRIQFYVREQASSGVVDAVLSGELDLGVVTLRPDTPVPPQLEVERWVTDELRLIVPKSHKLYEQRTFRWAELDQVPLVLFEAGSAIRQIIESRLASEGVAVDIVMELRSIESIKQMVAQGIGGAFVSQFALGEEHGLRASKRPIKRELALVYRTDRTQSTAAATFLKMVRAAA